MIKWSSLLLEIILSVNYSYIQIRNHVQTAEIKQSVHKWPDMHYWLPTNVVLKLTDAYLYCSDLFTWSDVKIKALVSNVQKCADMQIIIYPGWSLKCINGMYGLRWHEHTGNVAESFAKSTTSGSSSNMLFSIMFLGRLARSSTHRGSEIRRIILKKGNESRWANRMQIVIYIGTNTQYCMLTLCAGFLEFRVFHWSVVATNHLLTQRLVIVTALASSSVSC